MKYYRNVTIPMSCGSIFPCYVTIISNFFIVIFTFSFFHFFFTILILLKTRFYKLKSSILASENSSGLTKLIINANKFVSKTNKSKSRIFVSKNSNRLIKFIINTNKFVSKTTRNVTLILF